jgi:hypothetical protein
MGAIAAQSIEDHSETAPPQPGRRVAAIFDHVVGGARKKDDVSTGDVGTNGGCRFPNVFLPKSLSPSSLTRCFVDEQLEAVTGQKRHE